MLRGRLPLFIDEPVSWVHTFSPRQGSIAIADSHSELIEGTEDGITVDIEPNAIVCVLSKLVPKIIANCVGPFVDGFLSRNSLNRKDGEC